MKSAFFGCGMDEARLHGIVAEIYDRCLTPTGMSEAGAPIERALGIGSSLHFVSEQSSGRMVRLLSASANFDAGARRDYAAHYHDLNPWFQRAKSRPPPVIVRGEELIDANELLTTEFGADWCPRIGIFHMMGSTYRLPGGLIGGSGVHRTRRQGPFGDDDMRLYGLLMRHFANAVSLMIRLNRHAGQQVVAENVVEALDIGAILLREDRTVIQANRTAEAVLRRKRWLTVVDGRLRAVHYGSQGVLSRQIALAARTGAGSGTDPGAVLRLDPSGADPLPILVLPFRSAHDVGGRSQPMALLLFRDPDIVSAPPPAALKQAYDLSEAESRLVALLVDGNSLTRAARIAGISPNTAKSQLRSVFARTGFSRQTDLVADIRGNHLLWLQTGNEATGRPGSNSSTAPTG